ncbi:hypothetical protein [Frankia sp. QA3]|uniref:hypothetical protein n=1 Tax=Frankia sp. QA3 TaxID=710111 RepID=UPI0005621CB2|nr:hypothetical protein [Frankia sp. QA3]
MPAPAAGTPASGDDHQPSRPGPRRRGRCSRGFRPARTTLAAAGATIALTGLLAVADVGVARAGGVVWASCPSGQVSEVSVPASDGAPATGATWLEAGYYAHIATSWPPSTAQLCRTEAGRGPDAGEPTFRFEHQGCPGGEVTFGVPRPAVEGGSGVDGPPVTWGTYLPDGWYDLEDTSDPAWTSVCWSSGQR